MKRDLLTDYLACILFRAFSPLIRKLPVGLAFFLGRRIGDIVYCFDVKHKAISCFNIKRALGERISPAAAGAITRQFYRTFGENLIDIFLIPRMDKKYIARYIKFEGLDYISEGFKRGKGVIFLSVHAGSWELSNVISTRLGLDFSLFVRDQRYPRLEELLNSYRRQGTGKIIKRQAQTRELIRALRNNQAIGMTADQGGKTGTQVKFFGLYASMPSGAVRLALEYDATLIPVFYARLEGPYLKVIIGPPFKIKRSGSPEHDISVNLQEVVGFFERHILEHPKEYLWSHKIWKYTCQKSILILDDGKAGHLVQSQALADLISDNFKDRGISTNVSSQRVQFKSKLARSLLVLSSSLSGKYHCQGCLWCLRSFLQEPSYQLLTNAGPDIIISCGSSLAPVNYILSRQNLAKSLVIMRPSILSTRRFDAVIMARHDRPPMRKNVIIIDGALNRIDQAYLRSQAVNLSSRLEIAKDFVLGILIGGDTKSFHLRPVLIKEIIKRAKDILFEFDGEVLITTSRRTPRRIEDLLKKEFGDYPRCKMLIIANENNIPDAVAGILALSSILVVSPESISMVSEAAASKKYVFVFNAPGIGNRHRAFLNNFAQRKYIYLTEPCDLKRRIKDIYLDRPPVSLPRDNLVIKEALKKIL